MAIGTSERGVPRVVGGGVDVVGEVVDGDEVPAPLDDVPAQGERLFRRSAIETSMDAPASATKS